MISANLNETSGNQYFETLIINGNVSTSQLTLQNLNAENILELYEKTVFIDVPQKINKLRMDRVYGNKLFCSLFQFAVVVSCLVVIKNKYSFLLKCTSISLIIIQFQ